MKRKHKQYSKPKRPFDKTRIDEEAEIKKQYGLKNKREIWKADAKIKSMREKAKKLIGKGEEEQKALFDMLNKIGMDVHSISDVLALNKENYLERRLQTVIVKKKLAKSVKGARQLITHKKVLVNGAAIDSPSYVVPMAFENNITIKEIKKMKKPVEKVEENPKTAPDQVGLEGVHQIGASSSPSPSKEGKKVGEEVPEEEKAEVAEEVQKTEKEVKEVNAEVEGR